MKKEYLSELERIWKCKVCGFELSTEVTKVPQSEDLCPKCQSNCTELRFLHFLGPDGKTFTYDEMLSITECSHFGLACDCCTNMSGCEWCVVDADAMIDPHDLIGEVHEWFTEDGESFCIVPGCGITKREFESRLHE